MVNFNTFNIKELVEYVFKETYGQSAEKFLSNEEKCKIIQKAVQNLRWSYKPSGNDECDTGYDEEEIRKAYMIAYYPYYIETTRNFIQKEFLPLISNSQTIYVDCFAGGPCPEIYGTIKSLAESGKCNGADVATYDLENKWLPYQKITCKLCKDSFNTDNFKLKSWLFVNNFNIAETGDSLKNYSRYTKKNKKANLTARWNNQTDIFIMQNYLSHIKDTPQTVSNFLDWFKNMAAMMKRGALFIINDLNYGSTKSVFENFDADNKFLKENNLKQIAGWLPSNGDTKCITHGNTLDILKEKIFIGQYGDGSGLIPKKYTRYYYTILQKI